MSYLYTVYFGSNINHVIIQQCLADYDIRFYTYYAPNIEGIIYDIESDLEFITLLSLKFKDVELISTIKGFEG